MKILGLIGPKQAGKDTAEELLESMKKVNAKISFAGPLKKICAAVFDIAATNLNDPVLKEKPFATPIVLTKKHLRAIKNLCTDIVDPLSEDGTTYLYNPNKASIVGLENMELKSPREVLQIIGTEYIRNQIFSEWHLRAAFSKASLDNFKRQYGVDVVLCVTDVRFVNEYLFLKEKFGADFSCFYIERPEAEAKLALATHPSELETKKIKELLGSSLIKNSGTIEELKETLESLTLTTKETKPAKGSRFKFGEDGKRR